MTLHLTQAAPTAMGRAGGGDGIADVLARYAGVGIWVVLGLAILIRLLQIALERKSSASKHQDIKTKVADPLMQAGAVNSKIYGWTPSDSRSMPSPPMQTTTSESDPHRPSRTEGE
ncbi:hypothetical protein [Kineococcus auxinigenes]|uniref:hypothetical protein n=1 Tax=unclassified Kineococcus TaxID=2621656 RepID=UPI003D7D7C8C